MRLYLAPLQGLTDWIFRESYHRHIGQFDKYFAPFIRVENGDFFRPSQCRDIQPEHNTVQQPVPQFLGNDGTSFNRFEELCLAHHYTEANINLGCPFSKVTGKGLGAGLLANPGEVASLLDTVMSATRLKISIKCRLGQDDAREFEQLIPIFNEYPLHEIIIHPRVGKQLYKGEVNMESFARYAPLLKHPVCYNGDITSVQQLASVKQLTPMVNTFMIGRGIIRNPFLLLEMKGETIPQHEKSARLREFHLTMLELCKQKYSGEQSVLKRFEELWEYHADGYHDGKKIFKQVKKCHSISQYESIVMMATNNCR